jgi:hypothetical protein
MKMTTAIPAGMVAPIEASVRLSASFGSGLPTLAPVSDRKRLRIQPIDATAWLKRSAGVS